ncbi:hypothetical protein TYRP_007216 [Tyrophagus putrescentiae]|nr:hypothetical protein TYRP_007216 [Tyrophagus putrescentiae]
MHSAPIWPSSIFQYKKAWSKERTKVNQSQIVCCGCRGVYAFARLVVVIRNSAGLRCSNEIVGTTNGLPLLDIILSIFPSLALITSDFQLGHNWTMQCQSSAIAEEHLSLH